MLLQILESLHLLIKDYNPPHRGAPVKSKHFFYLIADSLERKQFHLPDSLIFLAARTNKVLEASNSFDFDLANSLDKSNQKILESFTGLERALAELIYYPSSAFLEYRAKDFINSELKLLKAIEGIDFFFDRFLKDDSLKLMVYAEQNLNLFKVYFDNGDKEKAIVIFQKIIRLISPLNAGSDTTSESSINEKSLLDHLLNGIFFRLLKLGESEWLEFVKNCSPYFDFSKDLLIVKYFLFQLDNDSYLKGLIHIITNGDFEQLPESLKILILKKSVELIEEIEMKNKTDFKKDLEAFCVRVGVKRISFLLNPSIG